MNATSPRNARSLLIGTVAGCLLLALAAWPLAAAAADRASTLERLEPGMTRAEVVALVGEPDDESKFAEPRPLTFGHWTFHTTPFTGHQLGIAFEDGRAVKIVYGDSLVEDIRKVVFAALAAPREPAPQALREEPASALLPGPPEPTFDSAYLFGRLNELGAGIVEPDPAAMDLFDRIPIGGTQGEVNALLGAPAAPDSRQPDTMIWSWADGTVQVRYRAGLAREKQWIGPTWRVGVVGDVWTAETKHLAIRASGNAGA